MQKIRISLKYRARRSLGELRNGVQPNFDVRRLGSSGVNCRSELPATRVTSISGYTHVATMVKEFPFASHVVGRVTTGGGKDGRLRKR